MTEELSAFLSGVLALALFLWIRTLVKDIKHEIYVESVWEMNDHINRLERRVEGLEAPKDE